MTYSCRFIIIPCLYLLFAADATLASYADDLKINSDNLTIQKDKKTATFSGNVTIIFDNLKLETSKLIVFYQSTDKHNSKIKKIVIPEKLQVIRSCHTEIATADKGIYNNYTKKLTLMGNVHVQKEDNILITDKLVYSSSLLGNVGHAK